MITFDEAIRLVKERPYKIGHLLGFTELTELHNEWIKNFVYGRTDNTLKAHRGSYKTTAVALSLALLILLFPNESILFMRKTDADVVEVITLVAKILESDIFKLLSITLYSAEIILLTRTQTVINTNLKTSARGTPQLMGLGVNASLTGKHFERIFTDDIVNIKDRISQAEREHTKLVYMELQNVKNRGGRIVNTGTTWHKEDAFSIMPEAKIYTCYETGLMTRDEIEAVRKTMTPSLFAANYELKHIADENALFTNPNFTKDIECIYNGICHIDAGYGGEDSTAFTIMRLASDGKIYAFGKLYKKHVDNCIHDMQILAEKYKAGSWYCESNADKGYLKKTLKQFGILAHDYHEAMNKHIKIVTHLYKNWADIYWLENTDSEYLSQILDYTEEAEHDDAPDSAASLCRRLKNKGGITAYSGLGV